MGLLALIPAAAALLCLETSLVFAVLYARLSRRRADLAFAVLALCLAGMRWASFMKRVSFAQSQDLAFAWLRWEWVGAFLTLGLLLLFVSEAANEPLGRRGLTLCGALVGLLIAVAWTDAFLLRPEGAVAFADLEPSARGPFYFHVAGVVVLTALAALVRFLPAPAAAMADSTLSPLARHRRHTFVAGCVLIAAPGFDIYLRSRFPSLHDVSFQSLAAVLFCAIIGRALGKEILRSEGEKRRLAELAQFRTEAVRDVAHELKNPLSAIQMATQTLLYSIPNGLAPAEQCQVLEMCLSACQRLTRLINNMLDTARMEAGRSLEIRVEPTDLLALAESVLALQRSTTDKHRLELRAEVSDPSALVDGDKLHQALTNLVGNAVKFSPEGGRVVLRLWDEGDHVGICVSDEGIGMTPEQRERLFQPFERVVDPERKITGTGIGLHLVKRLVEAQGGRISVESTYGRGSTFTVMIPREPPEGAVVAAAADERVAAGG